MDDGSEDEFGPGEVSLLPPGHDAWVVGDGEACSFCRDDLEPAGVALVV